MSARLESFLVFQLSLTGPCLTTPHIEFGNLVTGIATLIVAIVLLFQLRKQNQQLEIQHKDTLGNAINHLNTRIENLDKLTISDPELNDLWIRGSRDWNNLKNDNERFRFRNLMRLYFQMAKDHFNLQKNGALPDDKVRNRIFPGALLNEKGKAYCREELEEVFEEDFQLAWDNANSLVKERLTNTDFQLLDIDRKMKVISILCNMCFQLGKAGVGKFKKMFENIAKLNFKEASLEMLDSRWAKQTPNRAKYLSDKMSQV